jgi:hypothetical protein
VRSKDADNGFLELAHHFVRDLLLVHALALGNGAAEGAALVHGGRGDDAALVGDGFEAFDFACAEFHGVSSHPGLTKPRDCSTGDWAWKGGFTRKGTDRHDG